MTYSNPPVDRGAVVVVVVGVVVSVVMVVFEQEIVNDLGGSRGNQRVERGGGVRWGGGSTEHLSRVCVAPST